MNYEFTQDSEPNIDSLKVIPITYEGDRWLAVGEHDGAVFLERVVEDKVGSIRESTSVTKEAYVDLVRARTVQKLVGGAFEATHSSGPSAAYVEQVEPVDSQAGKKIRVIDPEG